MLDAETRRRIDTARDILVGKVPDPKSQVEQITIALIYKFMDDMDGMSEELGGQRAFFAGEFARYGWSKLMQPGLGGHDTLLLYDEAIRRMDQNPAIPQLFRDIFSNAFLPYRDPETLRAFLKVIDGFSYDHSERLGDAFEYLLSVMDSQGDAGQFRTPRHIIDFIVSIVDPKKDEIVLDPACGTAGFLISSYKHIDAANTAADGQSTLTPDERKQLARNFTGYDISPDMVRLSLVNMYLHRFVDPHIHEYDTLTSDERWNEFADVILANPPFMSPKGGILPHNRFSIKSKRSEVLFVDYMAEHLNAEGRAGIIVPEGIIFQSQNAHKQLRKKLVEESLVAVVSLPAGVFNPYSGVKTSILLLDKALARRTDRIAFFRVENDGYDLGAQRRPIDKNDLPRVQKEIGAYLQRLREGDAPPASTTMVAERGAEYTTAGPQKENGLTVEREKIATEGEYNLSGERYRANPIHNHMHPIVALGDETLFRVESGGTPKSTVEDYWNGSISWATLVDLPAENLVTEIWSTQRTISAAGLEKSSAILLPENSVVVSTRATIGRIGISRIPLSTNQGFKNIVIEAPNRVLPEYVALAVTRLVPTMDTWASGGTFKEISKTLFCQLQIPLPPLEVQQEIIAEIEGYQKVIDGARAVVENYRPHIHVDPEWPLVELREVGDFIRGITFRKSDQLEKASADSLLVATTKAAQESGIVEEALYNVPRGLLKDPSKLLQPGDILISTANSLRLLGRTTHVRKVDSPISFGAFMSVIRRNSRIDDTYLFHCLRTGYAQDYYLRHANTTTNISNLSHKSLAGLRIPLPPPDVQQEIVADIEVDRKLVDANRTLIDRFENKIQETIGRVWEGNASVA